jgi:hypothetical protein
MIAEAARPARDRLTEVIGHNLLAADTRSRVDVPFERLDLSRTAYSEIIQHRRQRRFGISRRREQFQQQVTDAGAILEPSRVAPCQDAFLQFRRMQTQFRRNRDEVDILILLWTYARRLEKSLEGVSLAMAC